MKHILKIVLIIFVLATAKAADTSSDQTRAQGGTGYRINDIRTLDADENTVFKEDGEVISETRAQGGTGFKIRYRASDVNPNVTQGKLDEINLINIAKGPVVSLSPLKVFNVDMLLTNQTYFTESQSVDDLQLGDHVLLSGFIDQTSAAIITRVEPVADLNEWKLTGYVDALTASQFNINGQVVNYSPAVINGCTTNLATGDLVEVFADDISNFTLGDPVNTVTAITCIDDAVMPQMSDDIVIIEGFIDDLLMNGDFILAGQNVAVSQNTQYIRGKAEDIQQNIKVEVEGVADVNTGDVTADIIRFLEPRINLKLPVQPADYVGNQFNVAGVSLTITPEVLDPDGVLDSGINNPIQLQFRGYDYGAGDLFITRLNDRGAVDYNDVELTGFVTALDAPQIHVFGVVVDTTGTVFEGLNGQAISSVEFFNTVTLGAEVELVEANLDVVSDLISGGTLKLLELPTKNSTEGKLPATDVFGVGTVTNLPDFLFESSFE